MPVAVIIKISVGVSARLAAFPAVFVMIGAAVVAPRTPSFTYRALMAVSPVAVAERRYVGIAAQKILAGLTTDDIDADASRALLAHASTCSPCKGHHRLIMGSGGSIEAELTDSIRHEQPARIADVVQGPSGSGLSSCRTVSAFDISVLVRQMRSARWPV